MATYFGCLAAKRDEERRLLDAEVRRTLASISNADPGTASFKAEIQRAQQDWIRWMKSECTVEGLMNGGAAAPTPWLERCELRMMKERINAINAMKAIAGTVKLQS